MALLTRRSWIRRAKHLYPLLVVFEIGNPCRAGLCIASLGQDLDGEG